MSGLKYAYINPIEHHRLLMFLDAPTKYSKHALHCFIPISLFYSSYKVIKFTYVRCLLTTSTLLHLYHCMLHVSVLSSVYARLQSNSAVLNEQRDLSAPCFTPKGPIYIKVISLSLLSKATYNHSFTYPHTPTVESTTQGDSQQVRSS